jgi:pimeloyl-ACP methyl ester carboxylesterase
VRGGYVEVEGLLVHHVYGGKGSPAVLFVHGLGSAGYLEWRFNLPVLARSHRVYAPDLPGFGRSDRPVEGYGIPFFARVVEEYIRGRRLKPVLVGASMGGRVALEVALHNRDVVRKLVLVNSLGVVRPNVHPLYSLATLPRVGEGMMRLMKEALHRLPPHRIRAYARRFLGVGGDLDQVLSESYLASLREIHAGEGYPEAYAATVRALASPEAFRSDWLMSRLAESGLEVLLIWGEGDRLLPVARARLAHQRLPRARLEVIEGARHTPQSERPEAFNEVLEDFLIDRR